jgi:glyoxylase-like metal-dependent hydrolase (beta-lactamase superfamily II)
LSLPLSPTFVRRCLLRFALAAALAAGLAGCAGLRPAPPGQPQALAPGVYLLPCEPGLTDAANRGRVGNAGFIVGPQGVLAIDTGTSYRHGQALLAAIAAVTPLPVRAVFITHTRQEFLFGANAFRERGIPVHMHRQAAQLMASRCETCLKNLKALLGEAEMQGTSLFKPDVVFDQGHALALIGRPVRVLHFGHSSGPGDIALLDEASGVLFGGGLLDTGRIPDVQDGRLPAWQAALAQLAALPLQRVVPGHGPAMPPSAIATEQRYLASLETLVDGLLKSGTSLAEVVDRAELPDFRDWAGYDTIHRRNTSLVFLRLEQAQLFK